MGQKVSVVIRTRSRPASLSQAIESVLCQTWKDIEIIVVNDGAPVGMEEVIFKEGRQVDIKYLVEKGLIKLLSTKNRGNRSHAANIGWKNSTANLILFLDDDDLLLRNHIKSLIESLQKNPWCSIAFSGALEEDSHGKRFPLKIHKIDLPSLARENLFPLHCALVRKSALQAVNGFDESFDMFEDWDLWLSLFFAGFEFCAVEQWSAVYRIHKTNTIQNNPFGSKKDIDARWNVLIKHENQIMENIAAVNATSARATSCRAILVIMISRVRIFLSIILFKIMKILL